MVLFLDSSPQRAAIVYQRWPEEKRSKTVWTKTAEEAISVFKDYKGELEEAHLEHDLGRADMDSRSEISGMEVVRFLEKFSEEDLVELRDCYIICHTWNLPAGEVMSHRLKKLKLNAVHIPFGMPG